MKRKEMELQLKNFRCWENKCVKFIGDGTALLHGRSGKGKSSILEGICFAITGYGRNIVSQGKSTCKVTLEMHGIIKITRQRRPNVLQVELPTKKTLIDTEAQNHIDQLFSLDFAANGYMKQGGKNESFIIKTPKEKLRFLEALAFPNESVSLIKVRAKESIKRLESDEKDIGNALSFSSGRLARYKGNEPVEPMTNPSKKDGDGKRASEKLLKLADVLKQLQTLLHEKEMILEKRAAAELQLASVIPLQTKANAHCSQIREELLEYPSSLNITLRNKKKELELLKKLKENRNLRESLKNYRTQLAEAKEAEQKQRNAKIEELRQSMWKNNSFEEAKIELCRQREAKAKHERLTDIQSQIDNLHYTEASHKIVTQKKDNYNRKLTTLTKEKEDAKKSLESLECPSCNANLHLVSNALVLASSTRYSDVDFKTIVKKQKQIKSKFVEYERKDSTFASKRSVFLSLRSRLVEMEKLIVTAIIPNREHEIEEYIQENRQMQNELEKLLRQIERGGVSGVVKRLEELVKEKEQLVSQLQDNDHITSLNYEDLMGEIHQLEIMKDRSKKLNEDLLKTESELATLKIRYDTATVDMPSLSSERLRREINHYKRQIKKAQAAETSLEQFLEKFKRYTISKLAYDEYQELQTESRELQLKEEEIRKYLTAGHLLMSKISIAESRCLTSFVQNLQTEVQLFLDDFFPEDPMMIRINCFKLVKKNRKPEITVTMHYKGLECDYNCLSGGELQRVILAFSLVIAKRANVPLVMLDECTSNLDEALSDTVVRSIKNRMCDKPIIMVAHQVVKGVFNEVVDLN